MPEKPMIKSKDLPEITTEDVRRKLEAFGGDYSAVQLRLASIRGQKYVADQEGSEIMDRMNILAVLTGSLNIITT